jgi:hypothetical protein
MHDAKLHAKRIKKTTEFLFNTNVKHSSFCWGILILLRESWNALSTFALSPGCDRVNFKSHGTTKKQALISIATSSQFLMSLLLGN